jgi:hypothetical protein
VAVVDAPHTGWRPRGRRRESCVVDEYGPVVAGLENDIDEIENQLFNEDAAVS